jgi:hypothetical protein
MIAERVNETLSCAFLPLCRLNSEIAQVAMVHCHLIGWSKSLYNAEAHNSDGDSYSGAASPEAIDGIAV